MRPNAISASDQNRAIEEQSGRVRMSARGHVARKGERAGLGKIEVGASGTIAAGQLATGDQDRSIGEAHGCGELVGRDRVPDKSECSGLGIVDFCVGRGSIILTVTYE